jgi:hypothetical protein
MRSAWTARNRKPPIGEQPNSWHSELKEEVYETHGPDGIFRSSGHDMLPRSTSTSPFMEVKKMNLFIPAKVPCRQHRLEDRSVKKYPEDATDLSMSGGSQEKLQGWQQMTEERRIVGIWATSVTG